MYVSTRETTTETTTGITQDVYVSTRETTTETTTGATQDVYVSTRETTTETTTGTTQGMYVSNVNYAVIIYYTHAYTDTDLEIMWTVIAPVAAVIAQILGMYFYYAAKTFLVSFIMQECQFPSS